MNKITKITLTLALALIAVNCYSMQSKAAGQNPIETAGKGVVNAIQNTTQVYKNTVLGKNRLNGGRAIYESNEARYGVNAHNEAGAVSHEYRTLLNEAQKAELSNNSKAAFKYYEVLVQTYPNNVQALDLYSDFAYRKGFYLKAIELDKKLYRLTGKEKYHLKLAQAMTAQGDTNGAMNQYREIYSKYPNNTELQSKLIALNYKYGKFNAVLPYCGKYLVSGSHDQLLCGKSFFYTGNRNRARVILESYVRRNPSNQDAKKALSDTYLSMKDYKDASKMLSMQAYGKNSKMKLAGLFMAGKQFDKAAAVYKEVLKSDPKNLQVLQAQLNCYLAEKQVNLSIHTCEQILALNPKDDKVKELLGDLYMSQNRFDKASALFGNVVKTKPSDTSFLQSLADSDLAMNNFKEAAPILERLIKLEPNNAKMKRKLAESYFGIQDYEKSNKLFSDILKTSPNNVQILSFLVDGDTSLKNFKEAADYQMKIMTLKQAKLTDTESKILNVKLGNLYLADNNFKGAENVFAKLSVTYPDDYDILIPLSDIYLSDKRYPEAVNVLAQAMKIKPDDNTLKMKLAKTYIAMNEFKEAKGLLEDLAKVQPQDVETLDYLADSDLALNDYDDAIATLTKLTTIKPGDRDIQAKLGNAYLIACRFEDAKNVYSALNKDYPDDPDIIKSLADCHLALGEYQTAIDILTPEIQKESNNVDLVIKFSNALLALNRFDEARQILEKTKAAYPENNDIKELLGESYLYLDDYKTALNSFNSIPEGKRTNRIVYNEAECFRLMNQFPQAEAIYTKLKNSPDFVEKACIGLGYTKIGEYKFLDSRDIFDAVLKTDSGNQEAKLGLAITYLSTEDYFHALNLLNTLPVNDKDNYYKAIAYYKMKMFDDAYHLVKNNSYKEAKDLNKAVIGSLRIDLEPVFQLHKENGDNNNKLNFERYGFEVSDYLKYNLKLKAGFNITPYHTDGAAGTATEYLLGLEGRPFKKIGINSDIGLKSFTTGGDNNVMVLGKALVDYYATDALTLTAGYWRYNVEESLLSAAGIKPTDGPFAGQLVGQDVNNKYIMGYNLRLPHQFYNYGGFNLGNVVGQNVPSNFYKEANLGLGKIFWSRPEGSLLDLAMGEFNTYYAGYDDNRLVFGRVKLYTPGILGSDGGPTNPVGNTPGTGGYFSPSDFIIANKFALHLRGRINPIRANYYICGYMGEQSIQGSNSDGTSMIWGSSISLKINEEGRVGLGLLYQIDDFDVARRQDFIVNLLLRP